MNYWLLVNARQNDLGLFRCGFTLTRQTGSAVLRNRLRRWGKEYLRGWVRDRSANSSPASLNLDINLVFKRREKDFYRSITHCDFDGAMDKLVAKLGHLHFPSPVRKGD